MEARTSHSFHKPCRPFAQALVSETCQTDRDSSSECPFATHSSALSPFSPSLLCAGEKTFPRAGQKSVAFLPFLPVSDVVDPMRSSDWVCFASSLAPTVRPRRKGASVWIENICEGVPGGTGLRGTGDLRGEATQCLMGLPDARARAGHPRVVVMKACLVVLIAVALADGTATAGGRVVFCPKSRGNGVF